MKIGFANDHRGYKLKQYLKAQLQNEYEIIDFGTNSEESTDYPDYAFALGEAIVNNNVEKGIAICGSGIGISIACNKVKGIRCAKVDSVEDAKATRIDNDSNIVAFGEKMPEEKALEIVKTFLTTETSLEEKHVRRRNKLRKYEENN